MDNREFPFSFGHSHISGKDIRVWDEQGRLLIFNESALNLDQLQVACRYHWLADEQRIL